QSGSTLRASKAQLFAEAAPGRSPYYSWSGTGERLADAASPHTIFVEPVGQSSDPARCVGLFRRFAVRRNSGDPEPSPNAKHPALRQSPLLARPGERPEDCPGPRPQDERDATR